MARHHSLGGAAVQLFQLSGLRVDEEGGHVAGRGFAIVGSELVHSVEEAARGMNCKVARALGLGRQFGGRELTGLAVEPRDVDALALAVAEPRKGRRVGAPVDEVVCRQPGHAAPEALPLRQRGEMYVVS